VVFLAQKLNRKLKIEFCLVQPKKEFGGNLVIDSICCIYIRKKKKQKTKNNCLCMIYAQGQRFGFSSHLSAVANKSGKDQTRNVREDVNETDCLCVNEADCFCDIT